MDNIANNGKVFSVTLIYLSHGLSAWGDRMWDFAVGLYMVILYPKSLMLTAILGFMTSLTVITFGSLIGNWIDKTARIKAASAAIIVQNGTIALAAVVLALNFSYANEIQTAWNGVLQPILFALIILASVISNLASVASEIAIEKDWVVILTDGDERSLALMNSVMRTIDLTTKILAPVAIGALISFWSGMASAIFVAGWNVISGFIEVYLLVTICNRVPQLQKKDAKSSGEAQKNLLKKCFNGWRQYFNHPVKLAGLGFSCLYMSVLGMDQTTIGYMYSQGVEESFIGIITAFSAIVGIIGSISYPSLRKRFGKNIVAILGYILNAICLFICVISIFMPGSPFEFSAILHPYDETSISEGENSVINSPFTLQQLWELRQNIFYFVAGIVLARFGLWIADLSIIQLLQDTVEERKRGIINGVQSSINQTTEMIKFLLVIILPSSKTFGYLIMATWIFSCIGGSLYAAFSFGEKSRNLENDKVYESVDGSNGTSNLNGEDASSSESETVNETTPLLQTEC